jgi:hypothetical protein
MLGGDGMDSILGCVLLDARAFLLLRSFVLGALDQYIPRPRWVVLIHGGKPLGTFDLRPRSQPWVMERGGRGRQVVKFYPPLLIIGWRSDDVGRYRISSF